MERLHVREAARLVRDRVLSAMNVLEAGALRKHLHGTPRRMLQTALDIAKKRLLVARRLGVEKLVARRGLYNPFLHHAVVNTVFVHDWLFNGTNLVVDMLSRYGTGRRFVMAIGDVVSTTSKVARERGFANVLGIENALSTPLAMHIATAVFSFYRSVASGGGQEYGHLGARVNVTARQGAGKTSFVFWSCVAALRGLGLTLEDALLVTRSLFVNDLEELVSVIGEVTDVMSRGMVVPFVVVDDAVVAGISKYRMSPVYSDVEDVKLLAKLSEMLTVSREGLGALVFVGHPRMLPKPLRESNIDIVIEGVAIERIGGGMSTLWLAKTPSASRSGGQQMVFYDLTATIVPVMHLPPDIYRMLEDIKIQHRIEFISTLRRMLEEMREREGG